MAFVGFECGECGWIEKTDDISKYSRCPICGAKLGRLHTPE